jgi:hypothetical protein
VVVDRLMLQDDEGKQEGEGELPGAAMERREYVQARFGAKVVGAQDPQDQQQRQQPVHIEFHKQGVNRNESGFGVNFHVDASDFNGGERTAQSERDSVQHATVCEGLCWREGLAESFDDNGFTLKLFKARRSELGARWTPHASALTAFPNCFKAAQHKGALYTVLYFVTLFPCLTDALNALGALTTLTCCCGTVVQVERKVRYASGKDASGELLAGPWRKIGDAIHWIDADRLVRRGGDDGASSKSVQAPEVEPAMSR